MRKFLFTIIFLVPVLVSAQVQNGYVRTKGTSTNRYGSPIPQVQVFINGLNGAKVTSANGTFNFNLGGGKTQYSVTSVVKTGYSLFSPLASSYNVGSARLDLVMQSRAEKRAEEARITEQVETRITKSYKTKMAELQKDRESLKIALASEKLNTDSLKKQIYTLEDKIATLDQQYQKRNDLIDKMVEEYVKLDYATLDDRKAQLCAFIENGELERADSLLKTIDIDKVTKGIQSLDTTITNMQETRKKMVNEACLYWRGKYDIAKQRLEFDSAMIYVMRLADRDTTCLDNLFECATFLQDENNLKESEIYYHICIRQIMRNVISDSLEYNTFLAKVYNNLANIYYTLRYYSESESYHLKALTIRTLLASCDSTKYNPALANSYNNLGTLYLELKKFTESEKCYLKALLIRSNLAKAAPSLYNEDLAKTYNNLALLYSDLHDYKKAGKYLLTTLTLYKDLSDLNPIIYKPALSRTYNNLALHYSDVHEDSLSEKYHLLALAVRKELAASNPNTYNPALAQSYNNIAIHYCIREQYSKAKEYFGEALMIYKNLASVYPSAYNSGLVMTYGNLGRLYKLLQEYNKSEKCFLQALSLSKELAIVNPIVYDEQLANDNYDISVLYHKIKEYEKEEKHLLSALSIYRKLFSSKPNIYKSDIINTINKLSIVSIYNNKFSCSENYIRDILKIDSTQTAVKIYLVMSILFQGRYAEAEKIALEIKDVKDKEDKTLNESILEDLKTFEEQGVIPKKYKADVDKLRAVLNQ